MEVSRRTILGGIASLVAAAGIFLLGDRIYQDFGSGGYGYLGYGEGRYGSENDDLR